MHVINCICFLNKKLSSNNNCPFLFQIVKVHNYYRKTIFVLLFVNSKDVFDTLKVSSMLLSRNRYSIISNIYFFQLFY